MRANTVWAAALIATTGCSVIGVRPSPTVNETTGLGVCNTAFVPTADVPGAVATGYFAAFRERGRTSGLPMRRQSHQPLRESLFYIPAAIVAASVIYGYIAVSQCNQELDAMHKQYLAEHPEDVPSPR